MWSNENTTSLTAATAAAQQVQTPPPQTGIDIQKALDILADRKRDHDHHHEHHDHDHPEATNGSSIGGCHTTDEHLRSMGQTIDLLKKTDEADSAAEQEQQLQQNEERRKERAAQLHAELKSMSVKELLQTVLETQQQRVGTYKVYNESLQQVLQSGNMTNYMTGCANATAAFAVCSETIVTARSMLATTHTRKDLEKLVNQLQRHEKEKLTLTAAYHLELIRQRNNENVGSVEKADKRITQLLRQGVQSLKQKIDKCVEEINDVIEELRYAVFELEEEEDGNDDKKME